MKLGPNPTVAELSEFIATYHVTITPNVTKKGTSIELFSGYRGKPLAVEGSSIQMALPGFVLALKAAHQGIDLEWTEPYSWPSFREQHAPATSVPPPPPPRARARIAPVWDDSESEPETKFAGCNLPLSALKPEEVCPSCECLVSSHRNHPSNRVR